MILLCNMFSGMKIQWRTIWRSKHQVSEQIEENSVFCQTRQSSFQSVHSAMICSVELNSEELDSPVSKTRGSQISKISDETSKTTTVGPDDWRTALVRYLENPDHIADRKVWRQVLKYVMLDNTLYCRTIDGLLLK
jgi:hypothetical protein